MKRAWWIAAGLVVFGIVFARGFGPRDSVVALTELPAPMRQIRSQLLDQGGKSLPLQPRTSGLLGVVVEEVDDSGVVLVIALADGQASAYTSDGETLVRDDQGVRRIAGVICDRGAKLVATAAPIDRFPLPRSGMVRMYFLTTTGVRMLEASSRMLASEFPNDHALELSGLYGTSVSLVEGLRVPDSTSP